MTLLQALDFALEKKKDTLAQKPNQVIKEVLNS